MQQKLISLPATRWASYFDIMAERMLEYRDFVNDDPQLMENFEICANHMHRDAGWYRTAGESVLIMRLDMILCEDLREDAMRRSKNVN